MTGFKNSLRRIEEDSFQIFLHISQKGLIKEWKDQGYEYLTFGLKFSTLKDFSDIIARLGYDISTAQDICIGDEKGNIFKLFYLKPKSIIKEAFKKSKEPNNLVSKFINDYKEKVFQMEFFSYDKLLGELKDRAKTEGFKTAIVSAKINGEMRGLAYKGGKCNMYSRAGFAFDDIPMLRESEKIFKKKKIKSCMLVGECYARDHPYLDFPETCSIIRAPISPEEEDSISFSVYGIGELNGKKFGFGEDYFNEIKVIESVIGKGNKYIHPLRYYRGGADVVKKAWKDFVKKDKYEGLVIAWEDNKGGLHFIKSKPEITNDLCVFAVQEALSKDNIPKGECGSLWTFFMDKDGVFRYAGKVGTGLLAADRKKWWEWALKNKAKEAEKWKGKGKVIWVKPQRVIEVECDAVTIGMHPSYTFKAGKWIAGEKLPSGVLRLPRFQGERQDKSINYADLRLEQINDWKDEEKKILEKSEKKASQYDTFLFRANALQDYPLHPDAEVMKSILNPEWVLTEQNIYDYYNNPFVQELIVSQVKNRKVIFRYFINPRETMVLRTWPSTWDPIVVTESTAFAEMNTGRMIEVIMLREPRDTFAVLDLDKNREFPWERVMEVSNFIQNKLETEDVVYRVLIKFTGNKGVHIFCRFKESHSVDWNRNWIEDWVTKNVIENAEINRDKKVIYGSTKADELRIDILSNVASRGVKSLASLDYNTGLINVILLKEDILNFKRENAKISDARIKKFEEDIWKVFKDWKEIEVFFDPLESIGI